MPRSTEFVVRIENRPGTLGKCCKALGERGVDIMAFHYGFDDEGGSVVRLVVDDAATAKAVLDNQQLAYTENEVAQVRILNKPGEIGRAASLLGDDNININYAYCGIEAKTNFPLVIFGVKDVNKAVPILDEFAQKAR
jgi:hypothetical protein